MTDITQISDKTKLAKAMEALEAIVSMVGADQEQIDSVVRMIERLNEWRSANLDRLKTPDAAGERLLA